MRLWVLLLSVGAAGFAQPPLTINLEDAVTRARRYSAQFNAAAIGSELAREDRLQARAALLPSLTGFNQFIWTEANGTPSGVFVSNDGPHVYNIQAQLHGDIFAPGKRAEYQRAKAAEALAAAKLEVARRGLVATVVQSYYALVAAVRKAANARQSLQEAQQFLDITRKQEGGGEAAHADVVKAEILVRQRQRDGQDAELAVLRSRVALAVLLFPDYRQDFNVVDDFELAPPLPDSGDVGLRAKDSPDVRAARAALSQETSGVSSARAGLLPSLSFDYFYGLNANQVAVYNRDHLRNLGSVLQGTLAIPVFTWGAARSKVRQAELRRDQAQMELSFTQRELAANIDSFYLEAQTARAQIASLRGSLDLAVDSLRLTLLRYQAGEATALEVSDAQTTLTAARNALDDGRARYRLALAGLQTLTGAL
jgi:outer membrane protein TolC